MKIAVASHGNDVVAELQGGLYRVGWKLFGRADANAGDQDGICYLLLFDDLGQYRELLSVREYLGDIAL
jgi:hypothetical protein